MFAAILTGLIPYPHADSGCSSSGEIYLASNGKHIDLILPPALIEPVVLRNLAPGGVPPFISIGWGDLDFYLNTPEWSDFSLSLACGALFLGKQSAMHLSPIAAIDSTWRKVEFCEHQASALSAYISASFARRDGIPIRVKSGAYGRNHAFYLANGHFSPFLTCNEWVNRAFHYSGLASPLWSPFDKALLFYY